MSHPSLLSPSSPLANVPEAAIRLIAMVAQEQEAFYRVLHVPATVARFRAQRSLNNTTTITWHVTAERTVTQGPCAPTPATLIFRRVVELHDGARVANGQERQCGVRFDADETGWTRERPNIGMIG